MGNIGGVRKKGLTLEKVAAAMREVVAEEFPGVLQVLGPSREESEFGGIMLCLVIAEPPHNECLLTWWDQGDCYPGLIGSKHPRIGLFGYWLLSVIEHNIALKLKTRIWDEGVGYYKKAEVTEKVGTFKQYLDKMGMDHEKQYALINMNMQQVPTALHPWMLK